MKIAIAGGGTGGHLFPGLAVAQHAIASGRASEVVFFGSERGIEVRAVPKAGFELRTDAVRGVVGSSPVAAARALAGIVAAAFSLRGVLRREGFDVVLGLGGYASAPAVLGARLAGIPVVLLEQNRHPGAANRLLARMADAVCVSFAGSENLFPAGLARLTGNPLRPGLERAGQTPVVRRPGLLVFGGSAGASSINRGVLAALTSLRERHHLPPVLHQTGTADVEDVRAAYDHVGINADVRGFIDDMASAYEHARVAICRAGATSLAELAVTATPAILVPYPHAGAHQMANARAVEEAGAAIVVADDDDCAQGLEAALDELLADPGRLSMMAEQARGLGRPDAAAAVLEVVDEVLAIRRLNS